MPATPPYIPPRDADFENWFNNFSTLLTASPTTYGLLAGDATTVAALYSAWNAAFVLATNPGTRTSVTIAAKDVARVNATVVVRPYAQRISVNPAVANSDKVAIGVTVRSTVPTPVPPPTTFPIIGLLALTPGVFQYSYKDSSLGPTKAKPFGAIGMEVSVGFSATGSLPVSGTVSYGTVTKSPNFFDTTGEAGKTMSFYARWVTRSGPNGQSQRGPWSIGTFVVVV